MSATAVCKEQVQVRRDRRPCDQSEGVTLGQLLARAREAVEAGTAVDCPVCGGAMQPCLPESECGDCGSRLG